MWFRMIYWRLFRRPRSVTSQLSDPKPPAISARTASRDTSRPAAVVPADQDHRGSLRLQVAAALLHRGDDIGRVAALTSVPVALLELVRDEHGDQGTSEPAASAGGISDLGAERGRRDDRIGQHLELRRRHLARARHMVVVLVLTEIAAVASIGASLAALIWHSTDRAVQSRCGGGPPEVDMTVPLIGRVTGQQPGCQRDHLPDVGVRPGLTAGCWTPSAVMSWSK